MTAMTQRVECLDKGFVRLVDHMGSDLTVVNAARVSFAKESKMESEVFEDLESAEAWGNVDYDFLYSDRWMGGYYAERLSEKDARLIRHLAKHEHWTPFGHPQVTLHFKWPVFVARQAMRSNIGICWNEESRRYIQTEPEFYEPKVWRSKPEGSIKQGSGEESWEVALLYPGLDQMCLQQYEDLLELGIAPEMARMVLPQSMYTECWGTFSLAALSRFYKLRSDSHAQKEIQDYAAAIDSLVRPLYPVSWKALTGKEE